MPKKIKGIFPVSGAVEAVARKYTGKILTIIDACVADGKQNKAIKDLMREALSEAWNDPIWKFAREEVDWEEDDVPKHVRDLQWMEQETKII